MSVTCSRCGETHDLPLSYAFEAPAYWYGIPEGERPRRAMLDEEWCAIDGRTYFIKGHIYNPVRDGPNAFEWVMWVSLSEASFKRALATGEQQGREAESPYFCWLASQIPCYPLTLNLKSNVRIRPLGERPTVELEPTDHPLAVEQRT